MSSVSSSSGPAFTASGLASGIDTASIITQLMQIEQRPITSMQEQISKLNLKTSQYQNITSRANTLLGTIKSLRATSLTDVNQFQSKKATLSKEGIASVSVDTTASPQSFTLQVQKIATATKADGQSDLGARMTGTSVMSDLSNGSLTSGTFTIYVNGTPNTINVDATQTVDSVLSQISGLAGITGASAVNGKIQIDYTSGTTLQIGSHQDTSNFARATQLATATPGATQTVGLAVLTSLKTNVNVSASGAGLATAVTDGTFTINGQTFDTTGKTLDTLLAEINNNTSAEVTASVNRSQNRLELRAKDPGNPLIQMQDGTSNFLSATGLIVGGDSTVSQTAGQNAEFLLNGATIYSTSNSVGSDITGLTGVTLNLLQASPSETITTTIGQNVEGLKTALTNMVSQINSLFSLIDTQTDPQGTGSLKGESSVVRLRSDIRSTLSSGVSGLTLYDSLASVGISTGAVGASATATRDFIIDTSKLEAAIKNNPAEVENLFRGPDGILGKVQTMLEGATKDDTDPSNDGLFITGTNTVTKKIKDLNERIAATQLRVDSKRARLQAQFSAMEKIYAQSQSQQSSISNLMNQLNANSGK
ncbi:MAG: flagellar filament capping protein FliD [Vampirovibrionales bacterium]|nr:flagellar filament capping protein FliD [Vampirovibrionales bacterium]